MLRPTEINHLNRPEITALFAVDRAAALQLMRQLIVAYNPMIRSVGHYSFVTDVTSLGATLNKLRAFVTDASYHRALVQSTTAPRKPKEGERSASAVIDRTLQDWEVVTEALAGGLYPQTDRKYLSEITIANTDDKLVDEMAKWMVTGAILTPSTMVRAGANRERKLKYINIMDPESQSDGAEIAFIRTALCFAWDHLVASGHLVTVPAREEGVQKGAYERLMRGLRIVGVQAALMLSRRTLALRPYFMLLKDPNVRERVIIEYGANAKEYLALLDEMASLPMHPWHAMADSLLQPGRNLTPWGATTPTQGVDINVMRELVPEFPTPERPVDPVTTINWGDVFEYARNMKKEVRLLREDPGLALDSAFAALRFTSVGPRPRIALMGQELNPVHTDGMLATEPLAPLDLLYRPVLPARLYNVAMPWVGEPRLLTALDLKSPRPVRFELEQEDVPVMGSYMLGRLSPSQLRHASEWQGEDDAIFTPGNVEGLANLFGVDVEEMEETIGNAEAGGGWSEYFKRVNGHIEPVDAGTVLYVSSHTRRPSLTDVKVDEGKVDTLYALQYGLIVRAEPTKAQFVRDLDVPMPGYDISEKLRMFAAALVGRGAAK